MDCFSLGRMVAMKPKHYIPKKLNWNSLTELKNYLERETKETVVHFDGFQLVTKTTRYGLANGKISISDPVITTFGQTSLDY